MKSTPRIEFRTAQNYAAIVRRYVMWFGLGLMSFFFIIAAWVHYFSGEPVRESTVLTFFIFVGAVFVVWRVMEMKIKRIGKQTVALDDVELHLVSDGMETIVELRKVTEVQQSMAPGPRRLIDLVLESGETVRVEGLEDMEKFEREIRQRVKSVGERTTHASE